MRSYEAPAGNFKTLGNFKITPRVRSYETSAGNSDQTNKHGAMLITVNREIKIESIGDLLKVFTKPFKVICKLRSMELNA